MMLGNTAKRDRHNLYSPPNIVWIIESRKMKWAKQVAWMGKISWKTRRVADPDMYGRMLLNLILHTTARSGLIWLKTEITGGVLYTRQWNAGSHKRPWILVLSGRLLALQDLCCLELRNEDYKNKWIKQVTQNDGRLPQLELERKRPKKKWRDQLHLQSTGTCNEVCFRI